MKTKIDIKSALSGLAVGIAVMLALGAATSPGQSGRFQIAGASNFFMVLDTATGQVWGGNFNQLGQASGPLDFKYCPQSQGDFFQPKVER